jgi:hypothetical protein
MKRYIQLIYWIQKVLIEKTQTMLAIADRFGDLYLSESTIIKFVFNKNES